jgi:MauM/NapG family ferredoxin protein
MAEDKPMDRRRFFRQGLSQLIRPIASAISPLERVANNLGKMEAAAAASEAKATAPPRKTHLDVWLRPPGALAENDFASTCSRCGECVRACPVHCIKIDSSGLKGDGVPYIEPNESACSVCEGLDCMHACPTGALVLTGINDIDMGTAVWKEESCLRTAGQECRICVDECPLGETAIQLKNGEIAVNPHGCIGCGFCQQHCPTRPKSIYVIAKAARTARG